MIAILAGIKKASVRLLKKAAATRSRNNTDMLDFGALSFSAKVKRFTERIGRHHHHGGHGWGDCRRGYKTSNAGMKGRFRTCSSNEGEAWKTGWQQHFNSGNYQRVAEKCKMHFVKGTFGVAL